MLLGGIALFAAGLWYGFYALAALALFWVGYVFVGRPAMRALRTKKDVFLSCELDGIAIESPRFRTVVKWPTITKIVRVGSRMFVMIEGKAGLVLSPRLTSAANLEAIQATVRQHCSELEQEEKSA